MWRSGQTPRRPENQSLALPNTQPITSFAVSTSNVIALGHDDGSITLWDMANHQQKGSLRGHTGEVTGSAFNANGTQLVSGGSDKNSTILGCRQCRAAANIQGTYREYHGSRFPTQWRGSRLKQPRWDDPPVEYQRWNLSYLEQRPRSQCTLQSGSISAWSSSRRCRSSGLVNGNGRPSGSDGRPY